MIIGFSKCQNSWEQKKGENLQWQVKRWIIYPNASNLMNTLKKYTVQQKPYSTP